MSDNAPQPTITEGMSAAEIGALMASLRAQFKLTPQDVSERLHIRARYVNAMEKGDMKQMPGIVYARGYVHTYAEFLGLNPEQAVKQCFAGELPAVSATKLHKPSTLETSRGFNWRGLTVAAAAAIGLIALVNVFSSDRAVEQEAAPVVTPVPATLLSSIRVGLMPTPQNFHCLTENTMLGCFFADGVTQELLQLSQPARLPFVGELKLPPPVEPKTDDAEAAQVQDE